MNATNATVQSRVSSADASSLLIPHLRNKGIREFYIGMGYNDLHVYMKTTYLSHRIPKWFEGYPVLTHIVTSFHGKEAV